MPRLGDWLEIYYHVGTQRGISAAARHLQLHQTTVSQYMLSLEEYIGGQLFERSEFQFTPTGRELFDMVRAFHDALPGLLARCRERSRVPVRIAASELIQGRYMLEQIGAIEKACPHVQLQLSAATQSVMQQSLQLGEVDIIVGSFDNAPPPGMRHVSVVEIPLVLLVPESSPLQTAGQLWAAGKFPGPLVVPAGSEGLVRVFFRGLAALGMRAPELFHAHALTAVGELVLRGREMGLSLDLPELVDRPGLRALRLPDFEPASVSLWWSDRATSAVRAVVTVLRRWQPPPEISGRVAEAKRGR